MNKIKILFLIHDLGQGGAEKVLVNLVNHMDLNKFDITIISLFGGGINEQFLNDRINYRYIFKKSFPGNTKFLKLFSPEFLHKIIVKKYYDIEVSFLEGPCSRIISGCTNNSKKISWIHVQQGNIKIAKSSFRSEKECKLSYSKFDKIICVSEFVKQDFLNIFGNSNNIEVLYNTVDSEDIIQKSKCSTDIIDNDSFSICGVGSLKKSKGFDRLIRIHKKLIDSGLNVKTYILGKGPEKSNLQKYIKQLGIEDSFKLLGYDTNPYKFISRCDLFVCTSFAEGFSTATSEALILGTPVCTVEVSGMREMLGNNEYGIITNNNENELYKALYNLINDTNLYNHYKEKALERGIMFNTQETVNKVEKMLLEINSQL